MSNLIPTITYFANKVHLSFSYDFDTYKSSNKEYFDDHEDNLKEFIEKVHELYANKYTAQPSITKAIRNVDADKLTSDILYRISSASETGPVRFTIFFVIDTGQIGLSSNKGLPLSQEDVRYSLNWYTDFNSSYYTHYPIGFFAVERPEYTDNSMVSSVVIDLRVLTKDIENSRDFYNDKIINNLDKYFNYLKSVFKNYTEEKLNIDFDDTKENLRAFVHNYYLNRLEDNDLNERQVLFLNTSIIGTSNNPDQITPDFIRMEQEIKVNIELTSTPELHISDLNYKSIDICTGHVLYKVVSDNCKVKDDLVFNT